MWEAFLDFEWGHAGWLLEMFIQVYEQWHKCVDGKGQYFEGCCVWGNWYLLFEHNWNGKVLFERSADRFS